jgi:hypothetical protein
MRRFRVFLIFFFSIVVPLQGYAQLAFPEAHCPMDQPAMMDGADDSAHDCCLDADGTPQTGKACKSGQPCHCLGQLFPVAAIVVLTQEPASSVPYPRVAAFKLSFDPAATWRPPAPL